METQHTTEHTCITCPALHRDGENNRPHPNTYTHQHSCTECRTQIHGILNRIPHHHNDLDATPTNTSQPEHNIAGTQDTPLGIRIAALDELHTGPTIATANPPVPTGPDQAGPPPTTRLSPPPLPPPRRPPRPPPRPPLRHRHPPHPHRPLPRSNPPPHPRPPPHRPRLAHQPPSPPPLRLPLQPPRLQHPHRPPPQPRQ